MVSHPEVTTPGTTGHEPPSREHPTMTSRNRPRRQSSEDRRNSNKRNCKLMFLWVWILCLGLVTGLVVKIHIFSDYYNFSSFPTDIKVINKRGTGLFTESLTVYSDYDVTVMTLSHYPHVKSGPSDRLRYTALLHEEITNHNKVIHEMYLLEKSIVQLGVCPYGGSVTLVVIKGIGNCINEATKQECKTEHAIHSVSITDCQKTPNHTTLFSFTAQESDTYYIYFDTSHKDGQNYSVSLIVNLNIDRTRYDLSSLSGTYSCAAHQFCKVPLDWHPTTTVVHEASNPINTFKIETRVDRRPRVFMYTLVFFMCPLIIGLFLTLLILGLYKDGNENGLLYEEEEEQGGSHRRSLRGRHGPVVTPLYCDTPPKYEDLVGNPPETPPPPYPGAVQHI